MINKLLKQGGKIVLFFLWKNAGSKKVKSEKLGVKILNEDEFLEMIKEFHYYALNHTDNRTKS